MPRFRHRQARRITEASSARTATPSRKAMCAVVQQGLGIVGSKGRQRTINGTDVQIARDFQGRGTSRIARSSTLGEKR